MNDKRSDITALILDLDGVIWKNYQPIIDLKETFQFIHEHKLGFVIATNNSTKTRQQYQKLLYELGVTVSIDQVVTSSIAVAALLKKQFPSGGPVYMVGEEGLSDALTRLGFFESDENVLAVVVGLDRKFTFEKLKTANRLIREGAIFYGTNPDRTFPTPKGFDPGAGSILAAIETAAGIAPLIAGKPACAMIDTALEYLHSAPAQTLVVGDRLETDILSGINSGCKTALVLSGASKNTDLENWPPKPDYIDQDLFALLHQVFSQE